MYRESYLYLLSDKCISYDASAGQWFDNRRKCSRDDVLVFLIRALRALSIPDAGTQAEAVLNAAEKAPELSFARFKRAHMVHDYGARVKGRDVFLKWLETTDESLIDEIRGLSEAEVVVWLRRHCMLLHRFYEAAQEAGIRIKDIARIGIEGIFRHVFMGWRLVCYHRKPREVSPEEPDVHQVNPQKEAVIRYNAFIQSLFKER